MSGICVAEQLFERESTRSAAVSSFRVSPVWLCRDIQCTDHLPWAFMSIEDRALVNQDIAVEKSAGAADLAAIDLNIVAGTKFCVDAQFLDSRPAATLQISRARSGKCGNHPATT